MIALAVYMFGLSVGIVWFLIQLVPDDDLDARGMAATLLLVLVLAVTWPIWAVVKAVFWLVDGPD